MKHIQYNKLVRDRIPEIIESSGKHCTTEILSETDYLRMLDAKLDEELAEYHKDQNIEELADMLEVIRACAIARGYSLEDLECVRAKKADKRGGFEKKILLREVEEETDYSYVLVMREHLKQKGLLYATALPGMVAARKAGRVFTFEDHLRGIIYAMLSAHTQWNRIAPKLNDIDRIFFDFDPVKVSQRGGTYFVDALKSIKCASQCTNRQMAHLSANISVMINIEQEYGSMDAFVISADPDKIVKEIASGDHHLYGLGPALAWEYLRNVGIDGVKPDVHIRRFLGAERLGLSQEDVATVDETVSIVREMSEQLGIPMVEVDNIIWSYCAKDYGEICAATPRCSCCAIREYCKMR